MVGGEWEWVLWIKENTNINEDSHRPRGQCVMSQETWSTLYVLSSLPLLPSSPVQKYKYYFVTYNCLMTYHDSSNEIQTLTWTTRSTFSVSVPRTGAGTQAVLCKNVLQTNSEGTGMSTGLLPCVFALFQELIGKPRKS